METTYEIDPQRNLVWIRVGGAPSARESIQVLQRIREDPRFRPGMYVLSDRRALTHAPDALHTGVVLEHVNMVLPSEVVKRWALLTTPGVQFGMARMMALRGDVRGIEVEAFTDEREALDWLTRPETQE